MSRSKKKAPSIFRAQLRMARRNKYIPSHVLRKAAIYLGDEAFKQLILEIQRGELEPSPRGLHGYPSL